jgi:hypothetical protein
VTITGASIVGETLTGLYTYIDGGWSPVGTVGFSAGYTWAISTALAIDSAGIPYVAYTNQNKATVMKYDSGTNNWVTLGTTISAGMLQYIAFSTYN